MIYNSKTWVQNTTHSEKQVGNGCKIIEKRKVLENADVIEIKMSTPQ